MTRGDRWERACVRAYDRLNRVYPASFRDHDVGRDMTETFTDAFRDARRAGALAQLRFLTAAVADSLINGVGERIADRSDGSRMLHWTDVRYAFRLLTRSPGFSLLTVLVLSGGLGLSIFTFSFLYTAMIKPLPLSGGAGIVRADAVTAGRTIPFDAVDLAAMRGSITTLVNVGAYTGAEVVVGDDTHRRAIGAVATEANMFDLTRVQPILGRTLTRDDQVAGAERVIVLAHWVWADLFGADSSIVGRRVAMNGSSARVVGVMPPGYAFPVAADAWVALTDESLLTRTPGSEMFTVFARLAPRADAASAAAELTQLLARATRARALPADRAPAPNAVDVSSFQMAQMGEDGPLIFTILNLIASLILMLACINVVNLLLARANERARETAVRLALGATRGRLMMQSMWEGIVLCLAGGALATVIASVGLRTMNAWMQTNLPRNLPFWWVWGFDRTALIAAGAFVTCTIALLGGVMSARVTGTQFTAVLRDGGARAGGRREGRVARALVITQVATVSVLMFFGVTSAILAHRATNVDFGYDTRNVLSAGIEPPADRYDSVVKRAAFYRSVAEALSRQPAVDGVVLRSTLASLGDDGSRFEIGGARRGFSKGGPQAYVAAVEGSLDAIGVSVRAGRFFTAGDDATGGRVAVVSAALAAEHWPGRSPVGAQIRLAVPGDSAQTRTVVGVASDILFGNPLSRLRGAQAIYIPLQQVDVPYTNALFRHRGDVTAGQAALYQTLNAVDSRLAPPHIQPFAEILAAATLIATLVTKVFALCFGFALLLAVSGTYGLMAKSIGQRTREVGIRRALGATDRGVVRLLLGQGSRQLGVGVLIAAPLMLLVGVGVWHYFPIGLGIALATGVVVAATIVAVVLLATYVPTRRVLRITPTEALRADG